MNQHSSNRVVGSRSSLLLCVLACSAEVSLPCHGQEYIERASVTSLGEELPGHSCVHSAASISADGGHVAFESEAELAPNGMGASDIYVHDRRSGVTTRASVNDLGEAGNSDSLDPALSFDGKLVVFESMASNLVVGDSNGAADVFLRNLRSNTTRLLSVRRDGTQGNNRSYHPTISADGSTVAFGSFATNLVAGGSSPQNIYVVDVESGTLELASFTDSGQQGPGSAIWPALSSDGSRMVFSSSKDGWVSEDTNAKSDVFLVDRKTKQIVLVSIGHDGSPSNGPSLAPTISADGNVIAFQSSASNLVVGDANGKSDIVLWDYRSRTSVLVSVNSMGMQGNDSSFGPAALSWDGRRVAFDSVATNLGGGNSYSLNVFLRDMIAQETTRVTTNATGEDLASGTFPGIDARGRFVSFCSLFNLYVPDFNNSIDVFVADLGLYPF